MANAKSYLCQQWHKSEGREYELWLRVVQLVTKDAELDPDQMGHIVKLVQAQAQESSRNDIVVAMQIATYVHSCAASVHVEVRH